ncbi:hypothetical protein [Massilia cavernae]|uniref:hypothetical protein n=1 Tax=Massilia cavernae TaxID=2320864 RepID=UPI001E4D6C75|nr:hypothetical protein [Massilia cavernae]
MFVTLAHVDQHGVRMGEQQAHERVRFEVHYAVHRRQQRPGETWLQRQQFGQRAARMPLRAGRGAGQRAGIQRAAQDGVAVDQRRQPLHGPAQLRHRLRTAAVSGNRAWPVN